jgi:hypothetical protein
VSFETSFDSKQPKLELKPVSALSETKHLFRLIRFYKKTESFVVSIFGFWFYETNRNSIETDLVSVCFGSDRIFFVSRTSYFKEKEEKQSLTTSISRTAAAIQLLRPDLRERRTVAGGWWRRTEKGVAALHSCWTTALLLLHPLLPSRQVQRGGGWQRWAFAHTIYRFRKTGLYVS